MKQRFTEIQKYIVRHKDIADLGVGKGYYYSRIENLPNVTALDNNKDYLERINLNFPKFKTVLADVRETGLPDKSYDLVIISQVLEHFEDYRPILEEAKRICKDDGFFLIGTPIEMHEEKHFHPVWAEADLISLAGFLGTLVDIKKLENSWLIYVKNV